MSEEQNTEETGSVETPMTEIDTLKQRARTMGIAIPGNIGITSLKNKIEARLSGSSAAGAGCQAWLVHFRTGF
jgi:hypothetical protein